MYPEKPINHRIEEKVSSQRLAMFFATSGHSGVDRIVGNLLHEFAILGLGIDLLRIRKHGPYIDNILPNVRIVDLGVTHVTSSFFPLVRYLRMNRPNAILCDKDRVNRIVLLAHKLAGVPTRVIIRTGTTVSIDLENRSVISRCMQIVSIRNLYKRADEIIVPSQGAANDLAILARLPRIRISVVPNPILTQQLYQQAREPVDHPWFNDKHVPVILGVGELCARKDFAVLLCAFATVRTRMPSRLVILGEGKHRQQLEKLADQLGISEDVSMPGFVQNPYAYMSRARLFVLSSRWEGLSNVLIEALSLGIPVVSTDCPSGPKEILQGGKFGRLVPVGDATAMTNAILEILGEDSNRSRLIAAVAPYKVEWAAKEYLRVLGIKH